MAVTLKINGTNRNSHCITSKPTFSLPLQGQRGSSTFTLKALAGDSYAPSEGNAVEWLDDGVSVFQGTIDTYTKKPIGLTGGFYYQVTAVTLEQRLDKRFVTRSFAAGLTTGAIVADILGNEAATESISAGNISAGITLSSAKLYDHARISDVFTDLAGLNSDFIWYIKDGALNFEVRTTTAAPFTVSDADLLRQGNPATSFSRSEYRNRQHVKISETNLVANREQFLGDGATSSFTLANAIREIVGISLTNAVSSAAAGTFTGNPSPNDYVIVGDHTYIFKSSTADPFNIGDMSLNFAFSFTVFVLIGATAADTAANLVSAVNGGSGRGEVYSQYAVANTIASLSLVSLTLTVTGLPGANSNGLNLQASSASFSWAGSAAGGSDGGLATQTFSESSQAGTGNYQWTYDAGGNTITLAAGALPPPTGETVLVQYKPVGFGVVTVDDPVEIATRALAEQGSGIYENIAIREDLLTVDEGAAAAQALLDSYGQIAQRIPFSTDTFGLLPGQLVTINSTKLGINGNFLIQSVDGVAVGPNHFRQHFRYNVIAVTGTKPQTSVGFFNALANASGPSGAVSNTGSGGTGTTVENKVPGVAGDDAQIGWELNFGIDDDTVGTDVISKFAPFKGDGQAYTGYVTIDRLGTTETVIDALFSADKGATWNSLFGPNDGDKIVIPAAFGDQDVNFDANPRVREITNFAENAIKKGWIARLDVLQSGGATGIEIYLRGKPSGVRGTQLTYAGPGIYMIPLLP